MPLPIHWYEVAYVAGGKFADPSITTASHDDVGLLKIKHISQQHIRHVSYSTIFSESCYLYRAYCKFEL